MVKHVRLKRGGLLKSSPRLRKTVRPARVCFPISDVCEQNHVINIHGKGLGKPCTELRDRFELDLHAHRSSSPVPRSLSAASGSLSHQDSATARGPPACPPTCSSLLWTRSAHSSCSPRRCLSSSRLDRVGYLPSTGSRWPATYRRRTRSHGLSTTAGWRHAAHLLSWSA